MEKIYIDYNDIEQLVETVLAKMQAELFQPSVVVGLTRGGLLPAKLISHALKIPMCSLDVSLRDKVDSPFAGNTTTWIPEEIEHGHRILVVDDINDTGATFDWIREDWRFTVNYIADERRQGPNWPWNYIKFAALIHNEVSPQPSDFYGRLINKAKNPSWIVFPWEEWQTKNQLDKRSKL